MSYTVPYSFVPGTKARAQEVNANFSAILDSFENIDGNKADKDLSNITSEGLDVIKNNSSVRNIGELIFSPIPLQDFGLHLLDGSLLDGQGIYKDFYDFMGGKYNSNITYNANSFNVIGNPTITNDGIASDFGSGKYIKITTLPGTNNYIVTGEFTTPATIDNTVPFSAGVTVGSLQILFSLRTAPSNSRIQLYVRDTDGNAARIENANILASTLTSYKYKIVVNGANCSFYIDNTLVGSISNFCQLLPEFFIIGADRNNTNPFSGTCNLKQFTITENGGEIVNGGIVSNYFTDEETWQNTITTYGECGKFVYDSINKTIRLPKVRGLVEYSYNSAETGNIVPAGLPNITGFVDEMCTYSENSPTGALYQTNSTTWKKAGTDQTLWRKDVHLDASRSSSIYGRSTTVQPQTVKYLVYIVIANLPKTNLQVNIDNIATDLNGKLDADLTNLRDNIRNFDGQWVPSSWDILSNFTASGSTGYEYSLGSYLPNDNNKYEVLFMIWGQTEASSGSGLFVWAGTDMLGAGISGSSGKAQILRTRAVSSASQYGGASITLPVGSEKKLYLYFSNTDNANGIYLRAIAYRRLGTNN